MEKQAQLQEQEEFCRLIILTMMDHPEWTPAIFQATTKGSELAFDILTSKSLKYRNAITSALALSMSKAGIKNPKIREACTEQVLEVLRGDKEACKLDKEYMKELVMETLTKEDIEQLLKEL